MKRERVRVVVRGAVQGVGFRPFVYRLATELQLDGWVVNSAQGVFIEAEGWLEPLRQFVLRLAKERPPRAVIQSFESSFLDPVGYDGFEIRESEAGGEKTALILPDVATCPDCLREIFDPENRRFGYPFTNCTNCGPRFSIIEALPYDRASTSMKIFTMCAECDREYHDPLDRRFHAQPNACSGCGPRLALWDSDGQVLATEEEAFRRGIDAICAGQILALKGLGGFQLLVDAADEAAVVRLRERKHRVEKPFAIMVTSLQAAREVCHVSELEERLLLSPEAPIVLVGRDRWARRESSDGPAVRPHQLALSVAPGNPNLGVMLPYTPLHHLLLHSLGGPVVATSGNLSDEPICIDEHEALERLRGIADIFLVHDRPIVRHVDDSIARVMAGREMVLRRSRGYAPLPVTVGRLGETPNGAVSQKRPTILALGAHLKNTVALGVDANVFLSQHIGDLETAQSYAAFVKSAADLPRLYDATPNLIVCDLHPDYLSTKYALSLGSAGCQPAASGSLLDASPSAQTPLHVRFVQHHRAHIAACMAENELSPPLLGVAWDGTGFGGDGTIWGGEFFEVTEDAFTRAAHLRQFRLPGGEAAVKEPRRCALGLLFEIFGQELWAKPELLTDFDESERKPLRQMLEKKINAPLTSSAGRLFDAVAALIGIRLRANFEGQAAMELEFSIQSGVETSYPFELRGNAPSVIDWQPTVLEIVSDLERGETHAVISAKFHNTLTEMIVAVSRESGQPKVSLSGGCFQNRYLTERTIDRLSAEGFQPYWHQRIPPNDGGISLGQIFAAVMLKDGPVPGSA